ncbi:unnamed protein product [Rhizoctonia solani]|uniref:DUF6532 domain-containing protein n=1 Tax=Rhizoctonia solani TaxID=456999 RepID=A0A8H3BFS0_9AGAM|nr:unnamed protein product [Rhizoctonia solani]
MSQGNPTREKRKPKDTPGISQFREMVAEGNKRRDTKEKNKTLKDQGVGSTIPESRKAAAQAKELQQGNTDDSSDEEFDAIGAEIRAEEARVDALRAKIATRDGLRFKKLRLMDEAELQKLWDQGERGNGKAKDPTPTFSNPPTSRVQPIGPAQRILAAPNSAKRKHSSTSAHSTAKSKPANKPAKGTSQGDKKTTNNQAAKSQTNADDSDGDKDSQDNGSDSEEDDEEDSEMEEGDCATKSGNGRKQRGKTSDFTGTVKKMVNHATIRVCAKLASAGMFCSAKEYRSIVSKSWAHAAAEFGVDAQSEKYRLRKKHKQAIRSRVNSFRSRIRDRLKSSIAVKYKLIEGRTGAAAKQHVQTLIKHAYHTKPNAAHGTGHFQHEFLFDAVYESYFTGQNPVGIVYSNWFDPMPLEAIAFVCSVIRWVIEQHETGKYVKVKMTFEKLREHYSELMDSLVAFKNGKQASRCAVVQSTLFLRSMEQAGCSVNEEETKSTDNVLSEKDFAEDTPTAEELKVLARGSAHRTFPSSSNTQLYQTNPSTNDSRHSTDDHDSPPSTSTASRESTTSLRTQPDCDGSVSLDHEELDDPPGSATKKGKPGPAAALKNGKLKITQRGGAAKKKGKV